VVTPEQTKEAVRTAISEVMGVGPSVVTDTAVFGRELMVDSLALIEIALMLEHRLGIVFPNTDYPQLTSVEAIALRIQQLRESPAGSGANATRSVSRGCMGSSTRVSAHQNDTGAL
jgi:acyl carrier protein